MAGEAETPFLKLKLPIIEGSAEEWGELLNADLQKIDVGVQATDTTANAALMRGGTDELKRTASEHLFYADTPGGAIPANKPHVLVDQKWVKDLINTFMPVGTIVLWWGMISEIPAGWRHCNGTAVVIDGETFNVPDLRSKFVMGAQSDTAGQPATPGATGGFATHEHNLAVDGHKLTLAQIASHTHKTDASGTSDAVFGRTTSGGTHTVSSQAGGIGGFVSIDYAGGTAPGSSGAEHNHTGKATAGSSIPPYRALCYIMKVAEV